MPLVVEGSTVSSVGVCGFLSTALTIPGNLLRLRRKVLQFRICARRRRSSRVQTSGENQDLHFPPLEASAKCIAFPRGREILGRPVLSGLFVASAIAVVLHAFGGRFRSSALRGLSEFCGASLPSEDGSAYSVIGFGSVLVGFLTKSSIVSGGITTRRGVSPQRSFSRFIVIRHPAYRCARAPALPCFLANVFAHADVGRVKKQGNR